MKLNEWLVRKGYALSLDSKKCRCPFHPDNNPSSYMNKNSIYCFTCGRTYGLRDFYTRFGVSLERVPEDRINHTLEKTPLFTYEFKEDSSFKRRVENG